MSESKLDDSEFEAEEHVLRSHFLSYNSLIADARTKEAIFAQTRIVLRNRRWIRRFLKGSALIACYLVGLVSGLNWQKSMDPQLGQSEKRPNLFPPPKELAEITRLEQTAKRPKVASERLSSVSDRQTPLVHLPHPDLAILPQAISQSESETPPPAARLAPLQNALQANTPIHSPALDSFQSRSDAIVTMKSPKQSPFERLRLAGDRQLRQFGNLGSAVGCYRLALDFATDEELRVVPDRDSWLLISLKEERAEVRKNVPKKA